ncbi:hypothetical protein KI387_043471, partial [Taxus chinensis]
MVLSKQKEACNEKEPALALQDNHEQGSTQKENDGVLTPCWTQDIMHFLNIGLWSPEMDKTKRRHFRLQVVPHSLVDGILFKKDMNGVLLRCISTNQIHRVLEKFHGGSAG